MQCKCGWVASVEWRVNPLFCVVVLCVVCVAVLGCVVLVVGCVLLFFLLLTEVNVYIHNCLRLVVQHVAEHLGVRLPASPPPASP